MDKTSLGDRMKKYEEVSRTYLIPRSYVCIRVDGRSFHTWSRGLDNPFDKGLIQDMDNTAIFLCENIQNVKVGYVQSDEISVITSNFDNFETDTFFDGNIQKISSIVASMATAKFNDLRKTRLVNEGIKRGNEKLAMFDCRCWNVPNHWEAYNTLVWRQQDAIRNSISSVSQHHYSHKALHGKSQSMMHEMLHEKGINWATDFTDGEKNGRIITKEICVENVALPKTDKQQIKDTEINIASTPNTIYVPRTRWASKGAWVFTKDEGKLLNMIPKNE